MPSHKKLSTRINPGRRSRHRPTKAQQRRLRRLSNLQRNIVRNRRTLTDR